MSTMQAAISAALAAKETQQQQPQAADVAALQAKAAKAQRKVKAEQVRKAAQVKARNAKRSATLGATLGNGNTKESTLTPEQVKEAAEREEFIQQGAEQIALAAMFAEEAQQGLSQTIIAVVASGITFAELEARALKGKQFPQVEDGRSGKLRPMTLKDIGAYRKIKSRILKAQEKPGFRLEAGMTTADLKDAAGEPRAKGGKSEAAKGEDANATVPNAPNAQAAHHFATAADVMAAGLKMLLGADAGAYRESFAADIRKLAKLAANEEAERMAKAEQAKGKKAA